MSDAPLPEADRAEGAPHPRFAARVRGQDEAQAAFLHALRGGRMHHAWLLTGPSGVGKATLAWQIAKHLLCPPARPDPSAPAAAGELTVPEDAPVIRRIEALSEPGLFLLRRGMDARRQTLRAVITVDEIRALRSFFNLSRPDGGWRVVIVDAADDMNANAANALLKMLEEPPPRSVFLMVAQQPGRLLPTIRSRCRTLACRPLASPVLTEVLRGADLDTPLDPADIAAILPLADGSAGKAMRMHVLDGAALDAGVADIIGTLPGLDRMKAHGLCASMAGRDQEARRALFLTLVETHLAALAAAGARAGSEAPADLRRLCPDIRAARAWAEAQAGLPARTRRGLALNLDPQGLLFDLLLQIDAVAGRCTAR